MARFVGNIVLKGKMECLTGLHIGGSKEKLEIGGVDSPVLRDPNTRYPYVPGSSLKGKMRALLSFARGKAHEDPNPKTFDPNCPLQRVFGTSADTRDIGPSRLIVRDAQPDAETVKMWKNMDSELMYTEFKPENGIDRLTSEANPRFLERVVKGSVFDVEFIFGVYEIPSKQDLKPDTDYFVEVVEALKLLEHSTLGKNGSRGYGQVAFRFADPKVVRQNDYREGTQVFKDACKPHSEAVWMFDKRLSDFDTAYLAETVLKPFEAA
jgi:CRISPR-associated protein Csm3